MGAARIRQLRRSDTDVVAEQAAEVTCRYRQPAPERRFIVVVERPRDDQLHRTADQLGCVRRDVVDRSVRTAPETRPVAGRLGRRCQLEGRDVLCTRSCATPGAAIDPCRSHRRVRRHGLRYTCFERRPLLNSNTCPDPATSRPDPARSSKGIAGILAVFKAPSRASTPPRSP